MLQVAVIGAGWAGCSAAMELAARGHGVALVDAARVPGGRARSVDLQGHRLDNGQHILLGAYRETLHMMRLAGVNLEQAFLRLPLQMHYPALSDGMQFEAPRLPAPLHLVLALLKAKGLTRADRMALARFTTTARWMDWRMHADCTVADLLSRFDQTERVIRLMWRPLCIAALNTHPEAASAQVFLNVLRDSFGARRKASDMLIPRTDLSTSFPHAAAAFLTARGGATHFGQTVTHLERHERGWRLHTAGVDAGASSDSATLPAQTFHSVVLATQPMHAAALLSGHGAESTIAQIAQLGSEPITTCYLQYDRGLRLPRPFLALLDNEGTREWGQFVFDRGQLQDAHAGLMAVVVSASEAAMENGKEALAIDIAAQLAGAFGIASFRRPEWTRVITEKQATFRCTPGLDRPAVDIGVPGLALAGDYTASDYPSTLESAVRSGRAAARLLLANARRR
ncbi:MAG: glucose inhibited division family protein [Herminiimonas sp.]|nr:glucose inhibited division family protein [Herminiimonas sp.]